MAAAGWNDDEETFAWMGGKESGADNADGFEPGRPAGLGKKKKQPWEDVLFSADPFDTQDIVKRQKPTRRSKYGDGDDDDGKDGDDDGDGDRSSTRRRGVRKGWRSFYDDPVNPNEDAMVLLLKEPLCAKPPTRLNGYWDLDTEVDIDYFPDDAHEFSLSEKGYKAVCVPVLSYMPILPMELIILLRLSYGPTFALIVTDERTLDALQWALNHFFAGHLVYNIRRTQQAVPAFGIGPKICARLREMQFSFVQGDEAGNWEELVAIMKPEVQERMLNRCVVLGDYRLPRLPVRGMMDDIGMSCDLLNCFEVVDGIPDYFVDFLRFMPEFTPNQWIVLFSPNTVTAYKKLQHHLPVFRTLKKLCVGKATQEAFESELDETATAVCEEEEPTALAALMMMYDSIHG